MKAPLLFHTSSQIPPSGCFHKFEIAKHVYNWSSITYYYILHLWHAPFTQNQESVKKNQHASHEGKTAIVLVISAQQETNETLTTVHIWLIRASFTCNMFILYCTHIMINKILSYICYSNNFWNYTRLISIFLTAMSHQLKEHHFNHVVLKVIYMQL